jgi:hypothetical protein
MSEKPDDLENGSLLIAQVNPPEPEAPPTSDVRAPARVPRWRRVVAAVLVVLGCVLAPLSVLSIWLKTTLLDTSSYVATMAPLAEDPDVQNAIADRVTNVLVVDSSLEQQIVEQLPENAEFLAPKITDALASVVHDATLKIVESDEFAALWEKVNERAHEGVVALLEGTSTDNASVENGEVVVELGPIIEQVNAALEDRGIDAFSDAASDASDKQLVLIESDLLNQAQSFTDVLQKLAAVLPLLTLACFAAAIWLSANRRRTILRGALGVALGMALVLVALNAGRHFYLNALSESVSAAAAGSVYDQVVGALRLALRTGFTMGVVVAVAAWLTGPSTAATAIRAGMLRLVHGKGDAGGEPSRLATYVAAHKNGLRASVVGIGLAVLVALSAPSPITVLVIALLILIGILLLEFIGRRVVPARDPAGAEVAGDGDG